MIDTPDIDYAALSPVLALVGTPPVNTQLINKPHERPGAPGAFR